MPFLAPALLLLLAFLGVICTLAIALHTHLKTTTKIGEINGIPVFTLPSPKLDAFTVFNKIYITTRYLEEDVDHIKAIVYHELGHAKEGHDYILLSALAYLAGIVTYTHSAKLLILLLPWFLLLSWALEFRADQYAVTFAGPTAFTKMIHSFKHDDPLHPPRKMRLQLVKVKQNDR